MEKNKKYLNSKDIRNTPEYITDLEAMVQQDREMKRVIGHEMKNRIGIMKNAPSIIERIIHSLPENRHLTQSDRDEIFQLTGMLKRNTKQLESIMSIMSLNSLDHADLKKLGEQFNLEETVKENLYSFEQELIKNNLGIKFQYNHANELPIYIFAHRGFINAIINTELFNLIKHAPKGSLSKQGIKIKDDYLVLTTENLIGQSREEYGSKTGIGLYLLKLAAHQLKGQLELYLEPSAEQYSHEELIGYKEAEELKEHDTFGVRLTIPMNELTFHPPRKN